MILDEIQDNMTEDISLWLTFRLSKFCEIYLVGLLDFWYTIGGEKNGVICVVVRILLCTSVSPLL